MSVNCQSLLTMVQFGTRFPQMIMLNLLIYLVIFFNISMECSTGTYTRSGPTYDEQSLYDNDDDDDDDDRKYVRHPPPQAAAATAWNFQPQASRPPPPSLGLNMGRGRGRGRGLQSSQPLRRPNLPGMARGTAAAAAAAAAASQGETTAGMFGHH